KMSEIDKLKETCDLEEVQACEKLTQIYQKDCDNNNSQSCFELGKLYENPAIRDLNKAKAYFVKADSLGLEKAKTYISFLVMKLIKLSKVVALSIIRVNGL
ncbi:TPA: hypothetical protein RZH73_001745, partial [Campylobacter coli]|nr:hypothetical protein [Campylobacter coli]HEG0589764.1 hypothetical protein [Campylobacter coli]